MSLQLESLSLDNDSFSQELETTFDGNDFEMKPKLRNSTRGRSKKIAEFERRIKKSLMRTKKIRTAKRKYVAKRR